MEIKLYDRNLSSPTFIDELTGRVQNLKFSTRLHGGFSICSFNLKADLPEAWQWIVDKVFYRLVITDGGRTLWEGRLEDPGFTRGGVSVVAYGYYANLSDIPYHTAYNDNLDVVIKAVLTANCSQLSSDQTHIEATGGPAIDSAAADSYLDIYPKDIVEKLSEFSDDTNHDRWYFAVWEDRVPYLFARSVSSVDWNVKLRDFAQFLLKHRGADLWNSCYALYTSGGTLTRTADADNTRSQGKFGDGASDFKRQKVISNLGEVSAAAAQSRRDAYLVEHKDLWPRLENMVLGNMVYDTSGIAYPSSWVRAGDVIRVQDLVPVSADLDTVSRDALRTYYIVETEYDMDAATLKIVPDTEKASLDAVLAQKL